MNRRNKNNQVISDVLNEFLRRKEIEPGFHQSSIQKFWKAKMGQMINKYTKKIYLKNKVLTVFISSSPLKNELNYSKDKILKMITMEFGPGYVKEVRIM